MQLNFFFKSKLTSELNYIAKCFSKSFMDEMGNFRVSVNFLKLITSGGVKNGEKIQLEMESVLFILFRVLIFH